jgi:hypothetical protein
MTTTTTGSHGAARAGRWVGAVCLVILALVLGIGSIAAVFVRNQVLNTEKFVANAAPLADDPTIQAAISNRISNEILARVDLKSLATQATTWLTQQGAPPAIDALVQPAVNGVQSFVRSEVDKIVHSSQFQNVFDAALTTGHTAVVSVLTGSNVGPISTSGNTISIDLGQVLAQVKDRLVADGFSLASKIPSVSIEYTLFTSDKLPTIRSYVRILDDVATWLPWIALVVIVGAVLVAPNRRRGIILVGLVLGLGLLLIRGLVRILVENYMADLPPTIQSPQAVENALSIFLRNVRTAVTVFATLFLLAAVFALLAGPSRVATGIRRFINIILDGIGGALGRSGIPLGPVPATVAHYRRLAAPIAIVIAVVVLFFNPSVATIWWSVLWVLVGLAIIEIIARAAPERQAVTAGSGSGDNGSGGPGNGVATTQPAG